jgi:hypothetical protein
VDGGLVVGAVDHEGDVRVLELPGASLRRRHPLRLTPPAPLVERTLLGAWSG